jgi:hypothetical protein
VTAHDDEDRVGITPKSWTDEKSLRAHSGVLHLGKRWYVVSADIDDSGRADGVRLDGPYDDQARAEAKAAEMKPRGDKP